MPVELVVKYAKLTPEEVEKLKKRGVPFLECYKEQFDKGKPQNGRIILLKSNRLGH